MQKKETIIIAGKEVTVSEISVTRIFRLLQGEGSIINLPLPEAMEKVKGLVPLALDVDIHELLKEDIFSEDIDLLIEAFKRTNPVFFSTARMLKLDSVLASLIRTLLTNFSATFAGSLPPGMALASGLTATDSSVTA
jgi:hypothetical protein